MDPIEVRIVSDKPIVPEVPTIPQVRIVDIPEKIEVIPIVPKPEKFVLPLKIRKTLDGKVYVCDHEYIDIVIDPNERKIVSFAKSDKYKDVYNIQKKMYDFLKKYGLLELESTQAGFLYGSFEATYPENQKVDALAAVLVGIYRWLQNEAEDSKIRKDYEEAYEEHMTDPDDDESTDFDTAIATHRQKNGAIDPKQKAFGLLFRI